MLLEFGEEPGFGEEPEFFWVPGLQLIPHPLEQVMPLLSDSPQNGTINHISSQIMAGPEIPWFGIVSKKAELWGLTCVQILLPF